MIRFKKFSAHIEGLDLVVVHDNGATVRIAMSRLESWILRQIRTDFVQPRVEFDRPDEQNQGTKAARRRPE